MKSTVSKWENFPIFFFLCFCRLWVCERENGSVRQLSCTENFFESFLFCNFYFCSSSLCFYFHTSIYLSNRSHKYTLSCSFIKCARHFYCVCVERFMRTCASICVHTFLSFSDNDFVRYDNRTTFHKYIKRFPFRKEYTKKTHAKKKEIRWLEKFQKAHWMCLLNQTEGQRKSTRTNTSTKMYRKQTK